MKILADNNIPYLKGVFEPFVEIEYLEGHEIVKEHLKGVDVLIVRTRTVCDKKLLHGSTVKLIATATIGYDHIDTDYCDRKGIEWVSAPGCNANAVQQWVMCAILCYAKQNKLDLRHKVLGVVGVGNVGAKIVEFAECMDMSVLLNDPPREDKEGSCVFRSFETLKKECDIITFHVPLIDSGKYRTFEMLNMKTLSELRKGVLVLNSSRGEVVDCEALKKSLIDGVVKDAILDVWENEPNLDAELLDRTYIGTPHIAGYSKEGKANGTAAVVKAVAQYYDIPLDGWYPEEILQSDKKQMIIDCKGKTLQDVLTDALLQTYSIKSDSIMLKQNPSDFERYRSGYDYRSEPQAWSINLENANDSIAHSLGDVGFTVKLV